MRWILCLLFLPLVASAEVTITEILYNPEGSAESGKEWVELFNDADAELNTTDWQFVDNQGTYQFESATIPAGSYFIVDNDALQSNFTLLQSGEELKIKDASGAIIATQDYSSLDADDGQSVALQADGGWEAGEPTPGVGPLSDPAGTTVVTDNTVTTYKEVTQWETIEIQPPEDIYIREIDDIHTIVGNEVTLLAEVFDATGNAVSAQCSITFGDGAHTDACTALHTYRHPGTYAVLISAKKNDLAAQREVIVVVHPQSLSVATARDSSHVVLTNTLAQALTLSGWRIEVGRKKFTIPNGTRILAGSVVCFDASVLGIDLHKYGPTVRLRDARKQIVAEGEYAPEPVAATTTAETASTTTAATHEAPAAPAGAAPTTPQQAQPAAPTAPPPAPLKKTATNTPTIPPSSSTPQPTPNTKNTNEHLLAAAAISISADTEQQATGERNGLIPGDATTWLVGLLALVGFASVPLFLKQEQGENIDAPTEVGQDDASTYTIKELT